LCKWQHFLDPLDPYTTCAAPLVLQPSRPQFLAKESVWTIGNRAEKYLQGTKPNFSKNILPMLYILRKVLEADWNSNIAAFVRRMHDTGGNAMQEIVALKSWATAACAVIYSIPKSS